MFKLCLKYLKNMVKTIENTLFKFCNKISSIYNQLKAIIIYTKQNNKFQGLEYLHLLTLGRKNTLRVDLRDFDDFDAYATYQFVFISINFCK